MAEKGIVTREYVEEYLDMAKKEIFTRDKILEYIEQVKQFKKTIDRGQTKELNRSILASTGIPPELFGDSNVVELFADYCLNYLNDLLTSLGGK